ncbi:acyl-CoA dehydrogenase/oxidase [Obelidium mucronatum]|nr:acyl-CoA dehydrogenase/oxidase [Obelidium mucronatum]
MRTFTRQEVAKHNKLDDLWIIIDAQVYDLSGFAEAHPGSSVVLLKVAGTDATNQFYALHRQEVLTRYSKLIIGTITGESATLSAPKPDSLSLIPYAESLSSLHKPSPYHTTSHLAFKKAVRKFVQETLTIDAEYHASSCEFPDPEVFLKMGARGGVNLTACRLAPGPHLEGRVLLGGVVKPEEFDYFHEAIVHEEMARVGMYGYGEAVGSGMVIGLPPVMNFGPAWMKEKVVKEVLNGEKMICLAITEPGAGSDVAGITCEAVKSPCGKFYIVNGVKKWITNSAFSHYFTTAVRTGKGYSVLLIERQPGVTTKVIKTSGSTTSGTSYVTFENVRVPVENLIGQEGGGIPVIMSNFNHERWIMVVGICSGSRQIIEECFKWATQRKVFGKALIEQPVIRYKLGQMIAELEAVQSWCDMTTYQMTKMSYAEQTKQLGGSIALLKYQSTRMAHLVSDNAVQIFGGRAITRTGMGRLVENFQRVHKHVAILGGSEEIMLDLGVRQAMKSFPKDARL